jgi:two-component system, NarL family, invasion response regulator UvrY
LSASQFPKHMRKKRKQSKAKIRVLLVDDHAGMREALRRFINLEPDLAVVAEADGHSALEVFARTRPDVILMDGSMPGKNGIEVTRELKQIDRAVKVIGLTLYESSAYLEDMIAAGAKGYVLKTGAATHIAEAIRAVAAGKTYFDESIPRQPSASAETKTVADDLSADELAVLKRVANGQTNDEIAAELEVPLALVQRRRTAAMKRLNVRSRAELARVAALRQW